MSLECVGVVLPCSASLLGCLESGKLLRLELCRSGVLNSRVLLKIKKSGKWGLVYASLVHQHRITYKFEP